MSLLTNHRVSGVVLTAALALTASHAKAQHGTFNLPFEAHWGNVVLSPGSYRISVPMQMSSPHMIEISSNGKTVRIPAGFEAPRPQLGHSYLSLVQVNGAYVVREFSSEAYGKVFTFLLPKTLENKVATLRKAQRTRLPLG